MWLTVSNITAYDLQDAWFSTLYACIERGKEFKIDRGSYEGDSRIELDYAVIQIKFPDGGNLLPKVPTHYGFPDPVDEDYLRTYLPYLMTGEEKENESYTYGQRICSEKINLLSTLADPHSRLIDDMLLGKDTKSLKNVVPVIDNECLFSQLEYMIWTYKNTGHRNNQMILQVGKPADMLLKDPPCLRHIDTRIQDGKLHFFPYFRSWDLFGGFPANLAAIELIKQYCASEIGVRNGEIIASSKGLHLYSYVWEIAATLRGKTLDEIRKECTHEN